MPQTLRTRLLLMTVGAIGLVLVLSVLTFNIALRATLEADAERVAETRVEVGLERVVVDDAGVRVVGGGSTAGRLNAGVWIFSGASLINQPRADPAITAAARRLASEPRGFSDLDDPSTKLLVVPIERSGTRVGSIVGGVRLESYETTESAALFGSIALAAAVLAAMGLLVWWVLRAALHPVARMTTLAGEWSHEAPGERFGLGDPRDELTRLGATLDGLLDRVSAGVRRERRLSAEIAHELKTPVSRIAAEAELALASASAIDAETSEALRAIRNETRRITRTIDALVRSAEGQSEGTRGTSSTADVVADVVTAFEGSVRGRRVSIETSSVAPETIGVDADLAAQILAPVVQNAIQYARRRVVIGARRRGLSIEVSVDDDGPGLSADETEAVFEPGWRGSAATSSRHSGAGLGLPLSRRLARGVDAEIVADTDAVGGRFLIRFPPG